MADKLPTALTAASSVAASDSTHVLQSTNSREATIEQLRTYTYGNVGKTCVAARSTNKTIVSGQNNLMDWDQNRIIDDAAFHSTVTNNSRMIAPWTGWYRLRYAIIFDNRSAAWLTQMFCSKNRAGSIAFNVDFPMLTEYATPTQSFTCRSKFMMESIVSLTANDYAEMLIYVSGGNHTAVNWSEFSMEYMGA